MTNAERTARIAAAEALADEADKAASRPGCTLNDLTAWYVALLCVEAAYEDAGEIPSDQSATDD